MFKHVQVLHYLMLSLLGLSTYLYVEFDVGSKIRL
jgi:hypothetical protein